MKKLVYVLLTLFIFPVYLLAQTPSTFNYQAVIQDNLGNILKNKEVTLQLDIFQGSENGAIVYNETQNVTTNSFGLVNLSLGAADPTTFSSIDWGSGPYYIGITVNGEYLGTSQIQSVPFAFQAYTVINDLVEDEDADPTNEIQDISIEGNQLTISKGSTVTLPESEDADSDPTNELELPAQTVGGGNKVLMSDGNGNLSWQESQETGTITEAEIDSFIANNGYQLSSDDGDISATNEIQDLSISNNRLKITKNESANEIDLSVYIDKADYSKLLNKPVHIDEDKTDDLLKTDLVNDLVTGGVNGALTAEQGKLLRDTLRLKADADSIYTQTEINYYLGKKIDSVEGKTLSTNDFTNTEKILVNGAEQRSNKNIAGGYVGLGNDGKVNQNYLPSGVNLGTVYSAANDAEQNNLTPQSGDICVRTDLAITYVFDGSQWIELQSPTGQVTSVNGKTGVVVLSTSDFGLGKVNNTSDMEKPVSLATQNAIDLKANTNNVLQLNNTDPFTPDAAYQPATKLYVDNHVSGVEKLANKNIAGGYVGLETNGKISKKFLPSPINLGTVYAVASDTEQNQIAAQQGDILIRTDQSLTYINNGSTWVLLETQTGQVSSVNGQTGVVLLTKSDVNLGNTDNTSDLDKPVSTATQAVLDTKAERTNVLTLDNISVFEPDASYEPATKKYVDDELANIQYLDKWLYDINGNDIIDNTEKVNNLTVETAVPAGAVFTDNQNLSEVLAVSNDANGNQIKGLAQPSDLQDATTKNYVDNITSALESLSNKNVAGGYVGLETDGKINNNYLPSLINIGTVYTAASDAEQTGITTPNSGDICVRTDIYKTFIYDGTAWIELQTPTGQVTSVNGKNGVVILGKADVNLPNVDNTSDANKPVSLATQAALDQKANISNVLTLSNTQPFTPDAQYEPATKEYVDQSINNAAQGDMTQAVYDRNANNIADDAERVNGLTVETAVPANADFSDNQTLSEVLSQGNSAGNKQIKGLASPTDNYDAVTKVYIDNQLSSVEKQNNKNIAGGYVGLGTDGKINQNFLPSQITLGTVYTAAGETEQNNLSPQSGDICVRTDISVTYIYNGTGWVEMKTQTGQVTSVNGKTGIVELAKADINLENVNNTADVDKPVSTATQAALDTKAEVTNVLTLDNTTEFIPDANFEPTTKKYVDDLVSTMGDGDMKKQIYDIDGNNVVDIAETVEDGAITTSKIVGNAIINEKIDDGAVTAGKIGSGGLTNKLLSTDASGNTQWEDRSNFNTSSLTMGNIFVGNNSNTAAPIDASGDAKILIGDGTTLTSQTVKGDITIDNEGTTAIGTNKISNTMMQDNAINTNEIVDDAVTIAKIGTFGATDANKVLSTDVSGNPQWEDRSVFTTPALTKGNIFIGNDSNAAEAMDAKGDAKILIGNGTTLASQTVSGDISIANDGTTAIGTDKISNTMMQDDAINTNEIVDDAVTTNKIGTAGATDANKLLSTDASGDPQWENRSNFTSSTLNQGSIYLGDASNTATALDAKGDAKILIGNGTTLASQTVSGDISIANDGTTAIGTDKISNTMMQDDAINTNEIVDDAVTTNKIGTAGATDANKLLSTDASGDPQWENRSNFTSSTLNQGSIYLGDASNTATALDAKGDAKILIGNGTTLASQTVSGDISIANDGTTAIGTDKISNTMMQDDAINTNEIVNSAVTSAKILDATIATVDIANDAVTTAKIGTTGATDANKLLSTDASGNPQWENRSNFTSSTLNQGSIYLGDASNTATALDAKGDAKILIGNGTTLASQTVSGDITIANNGTTTIGTDKITNAKMADNAINTNEIVNSAITSAKILDATIATADIANDAVTTAKIGTAGATDANKLLSTDVSGNPQWENRSNFTSSTLNQGNIYLGNASNTATALDAKGDAKILIGNGTTLASQTVSGDISIANDGTTAIGTDKISNTMMQDDAINTNEIVNSAVTSAKILDATIATVDIANDAVTTAKIGTAGATDANKLLSTDVSGNPQWENRSNFTSSTLNQGNIYLGDASNTATALDAKGDAKILIGNGTTLASQTVSGDITIANNGTTTIGTDKISNTMMQDDAINTNEIVNSAVTSAKILDATIATADIANDAVTTAKIGTAGATDANKLLSTDASGNPQWENRSNFTSSTLNQGNIYLGNASNTATALDAKGDAKILIGNGTTLASQTVSGDITIANNGTTTIGTDKITNAKMADNAINTNEIVNSAVTSAKILDATIATTDIANDAVTTAKIGTAGATDANKLLSTDVSGNPQWENRSNFTSSALPKGNFYIGNDVGVATNIDAKGDGKLLIGNGSTVASQSVTGDITLTNAGNMTINDNTVTSAKIQNATITSTDLADNAVTLSKIYSSSSNNNKILTTDTNGNPYWENKSSFATANIAEGNILVGNSSGLAGALDVSGNGNLIIGNGTTVASQPVTGAIAINSNGVSSINSNQITNAMMQDNSINTAELASNAVSTVKIADNAVTVAKIGTSGGSDANKVMVTDASGNPIWNNQTIFAGSTLAEGSIYVGNSSNVAGPLVAKTTGQILIGNGTSVASQAISGDISLSSSGTTAISSGVIVNSDVNNSAAIAGTKISPSFGTQNITTTGNLKIGNGTPTNTQDGEDAYIEGNVEVDGTVTVGAYTLPNTDGNNGDILKTDGSGTLTWASPAASVGIDVGDIKYSVRNTASYTKDGITWLRLDGQTFSTSTYPALYALLGTNTLPNAAGHVLGAAGSSTSTTSSRTIFDKTGEETHQMTINEMPQHDHSFTGGSHSHGFTGDSHSHTFTGTPHNHAFTSNNHTHTTDLSHTHSFSGTESGTGHDHSIASKTFTTSSTGSHAHSLPQDAYTATGVSDGDAGDLNDIVMYNEDGTRIDNYRTEWTNSNGDHSHTVTVSDLNVNDTKVTVYGTTDSGGSSSKTSSSSTVSGTTNNTTAGGTNSIETVGGTVDATTVTGTIGNNGNGNAMNIMQPTLFVGYVYICAKIGY